MTKQEIQEFARQTMDTYGFKHIPFKWDNARRRLGCVVFRRSDRQPLALSLSQVIVPHLSDADARDVVLHEVAHLIAGTRAGHGPKWKQACVAIGARPDRVSSHDIPVDLKLNVASHVLVCTKCGKEIPMYRRLKHDASRYTHKNCGGKLEYR